jgi:putative membrane protein
MLVSLFERKVVILPDKGLGERLTKDAAQSIIHHMTLHLRKGEASRAFEVGLVKISGILGISKEKTGDNELPDDIIEEKGV